MRINIFCTDCVGLSFFDLVSSSIFPLFFVCLLLLLYCCSLLCTYGTVVILSIRKSSDRACACACLWILSVFLVVHIRCWLRVFFFVSLTFSGEICFTPIFILLPYFFFFWLNGLQYNVCSFTNGSEWKTEIVLNECSLDSIVFAVSYALFVFIPSVYVDWSYRRN